MPGLTTSIRLVTTLIIGAKSEHRLFATRLGCCRRRRPGWPQEMLLALVALFSVYASSLGLRV